MATKYTTLRPREMSDDKNKPEPVIKLKVSKEFKEEVRAFAQESEVSISALARLALQDFIRNRKVRGGEG